MAQSPIQVKVIFNRIPQYVASMKSDGAAHVEGTADDIAADAQSRAPVDTGELRDSIKRAGGGLKSTVEVGAKHGVYQEFGTSRSPAHPFLWPAVEAARAGYIAGWHSILAGSGGRSGSLTVRPGRAAIAALKAGR